MLHGCIEMEDIKITWDLMPGSFDKFELVVRQTNPDQTRKTEIHQNVDGRKLMKAVAIAVHWEGEPEVLLDYPDAEEIVALGTIRWIP